jgi:hypothetical protein
MSERHPNDMSDAELMALRAVNRARPPVARSFTDEAGRIWNIAQGLGEPWVRIYAGYDLDARALPYITGPGVADRPRRTLLNGT